MGSKVTNLGILNDTQKLFCNMNSVTLRMGQGHPHREVNAINLKPKTTAFVHYTAFSICCVKKSGKFIAHYV